MLPLPQIQILGGGAHAGRRVDIQDFLVMCPAATSFAEALDWTAEVYRAAGAIMKQRGLLQGVADEGGWWPAFTANEQALETLVAAIEKAGFAPGRQVAIALDIAATDFGKGGRAAAIGAANTVLVKPNQRGTLTEAKAAWDAAREVGFAGIVSARSGETEDVTIVHLAMGWGVGQLKVGSFARSERMAKWNEALRVEESLGARARFAGGAHLGRSRP
jgi:enolase